MYDIVKCEMPLPGNRPCPRIDDFQTKDFSEVPSMDHFTIKANGMLLCEGEPFDFDGTVRFYDGEWDSRAQKFGRWWEYRAKFINGKCVELTCVSDGVIDHLG